MYAQVVDQQTHQEETDQETDNSHQPDRANGACHGPTPLVNKRPPPPGLARQSPARELATPHGVWLLGGWQPNQPHQAVLIPIRDPPCRELQVRRMEPLRPLQIRSHICRKKNEENCSPYYRDNSYNPNYT
uniref:Uncharacterized protein n=1 Tax=Sphaerodactylus townsendi TaxID=933632 RepID=A0ACB8G172_9SAUR